MKNKVLSMVLVCLMGAPVWAVHGPTEGLDDLEGASQTQKQSVDPYEAIGMEVAETLLEVWNVLKPHLQTPSGATMSFLVFAALLRCVTSPSVEG